MAASSLKYNAPRVRIVVASIGKSQSGARGRCRGSIRAGIQGQSGSAVDAAGERRHEEGGRRGGQSADTLERWRSEALASGKKSGGWTAAARFEAVLLTASMSEAQRAAWCREKGLFPSGLEDGAATQALAQRAERSEPMLERRWIRELEKELGRKDKALAGAATLLVLSKKSRRSTAGTRTNDPRGRASRNGPGDRTGTGGGCAAGSCLRDRRQ